MVRMQIKDESGVCVYVCVCTFVTITLVLLIGDFSFMGCLRFPRIINQVLYSQA